MNKKPIISATVYLGSSGHARNIFYTQAYDLGKRMAAENIELVFGGMNAGSMRSLCHGVMEHGGQVTGIIPTRIRDSERVYHDINELIDVETMWERKKLMFERGDALIMLPGGYGTLDEGLEALYWKALGLHDKEIIFVDIDGFWKPLMDYINYCVQNSTMDKYIESLFSVVNQVNEICFKSIFLTKKTIAHDSFPHFEDEIFAPTRTPLIIDKPDLPLTYKLMTALVTRQLSAHDRQIGLLNKNGQFDHLLKWVRLAAKERFITRHCPHLMTIRKTEKGLMQALEKKDHILIDVQRDKWGD